MVTRLVALLGALAMGGFVWVWPPGGLLLLGVALLLLALIRNENEKAVQRVRRSAPDS